MTQLQPGDALIVVDMQRDFMPGGALPVAGGDGIVPTINNAVNRFRLAQLPIFFSRDWHPANHCSFTAQGGRWPSHCVAGTSGAEFADGLEIPPDAHVVSKATDADHDAYSAFQDTGLAHELRRLGVRRVFVCGVATEFCVRATVEAARDAGLRTVVLSNAIRAIDAHPGGGDAALRAMHARGAVTEMFA